MSEPGALVSIIIVNWNTRDLLAQCIRSIVDSADDWPYEIIVVDNASTDGSAELIREQFPNMPFLVNSENRGFGAANNQGAAASKGDYLLFLNPDTIVQPGAVTTMARFLARKEDAGIVGCSILNPDGTPQRSCWDGFPDVAWCWRSAIFLQNTGPRRHPARSEDSTGPIVVSHLLGACMMTRRDLFAQLSGFDERYFLYLEETDLCYRASLLGRSNYYLPDAIIIHLGQQSALQSCDWTSLQFHFSAYAFIRNTCDLPGYRWAVVIAGMALGSLARIVLWTARLALGRPKRVTSKMMLSGYLRLFARVWQFESLLKEHSGRAVRL